MADGRTPWWDAHDMGALKRASAAEFKRYVLYVTHREGDRQSAMTIRAVQANMLLKNETVIQDADLIPRERRPEWLTHAPILIDQATGDGYSGKAILEFILHDYEPTEIPQFGRRIAKSSRALFSGRGFTSPYTRIDMAFKDTHEDPRLRALIRRAHATEDDRERAALHERARSMVDALAESQRRHAHKGVIEDD